MNRRMNNELAFLMARELLGIVENGLKPEERRNAFEEFFEVCVRGLSDHETHADKLHGRLKPSRN